MITPLQVRKMVAAAQEPSRELDALIAFATVPIPFAKRDDMWGTRQFPTRPLVFAMKEPSKEAHKQRFLRDGEEFIEIPWQGKFLHFVPRVVPRYTSNLTDAAGLCEILFPGVDWGVVSTGTAWIEIAGQRLVEVQNKILPLALTGAILNHPFFEDISSHERAVYSG